MHRACHKKGNRTSILARLNYGLRNCEIKTVIEKLTILRDLGPRGHENRFRKWNLFLKNLGEKQAWLLAVCPSHLSESFSVLQSGMGTPSPDSPHEPSGLFTLPARMVLHLLRAPRAAAWWDLENLALEFSLSKHCRYITQERRLHGSSCKGFSSGWNFPDLRLCTVVATEPEMWGAWSVGPKHYAGNLQFLTD